MRTATALTIAAIGAIFAFAVTAQPSFFSFHITGWVLMLTGVAGVFIPRRGYGWLRRRLVLNTDGQRRSTEVRKPRFNRILMPGGTLAERQDTAVIAEVRDGDVITEERVTDDAAPVTDAPVESEVIEQYIEE
jgi:hypothetical protein